MINFKDLSVDDQDELLKQMQEDIVKGDFNLAAQNNRDGDIIRDYIQWRILEGKKALEDSGFSTQSFIHTGATGIAKKEKK